MVARYAPERWAFVGPVPLDEEARSELDRAGRVDALIVTTAFHNAFVPKACEEFPEATVYLTRGVKEKLLPAGRLRRLPSKLPDVIRDALVPFPIEGMRAAHEVVLFHRSSRSVIVADLCMHYPERAGSAWTAIFRRLSGWTPGPRVPNLIKFTLRDRASARSVLEAIRQREPRRILMAHGAPIERNVDEVLRDLIRQIG